MEIRIAAADRHDLIDAVEDALTFEHAELAFLFSVPTFMTHLLSAIDGVTSAMVPGKQARCRKPP
jgi:hypothetical protein